MSLIDEVAADIAGAGDHLPLPVLRRAASAILAATDRLTEAALAAAALSGAGARAAVAPRAGLARLGSATTHLETCVSLLLRVRDEIAAYLSVVGVSHPAPSGGRDAPAQPVAPRPAAPVVDESGTSLPAHWWPRRVDELTGRAAHAGTDDMSAGGTAGATTVGTREDATPVGTGEVAQPARTSGELLQRIVQRALVDDKAGASGDIAAELHAAGAAAGLGMSGAAGEVLRLLAVEVIGREVTPPDTAALRDGLRTSKPQAVLKLTPGLPPIVVDTMLARACRADEATGSKQTAGSGPEEPADDQEDGPDAAALAVGAAVVVAAMFALLGIEAVRLDQFVTDHTDGGGRA